MTYYTHNVNIVSSHTETSKYIKAIVCIHDSFTRH